MNPQQPAVTPVTPMEGMPWWFYGHSLVYGWPLLILQLACLVHVVRNGRPYWWIWIIMGFPLVGALAYGFVEIRPSWGQMDWQAILWRLKGARERIRIREQVFEEAPTADRCVALATELRGNGMHRRACEALSAGLVGPFRSDTTLLLLLADSHLELGEPDDAQSCLDRCCERLRNDEERAISLARARILSMQGRLAEAEPLFRDVTKGRRSEAPRYYHAEALVQAGRVDEANAILDDMLKRYRSGTPVYRRLERDWFHAARRLRNNPGRERVSQ